MLFPSPTLAHSSSRCRLEDRPGNKDETYPPTAHSMQLDAENIPSG
jgi:hypothetical protein